MTFWCKTINALKKFDEITTKGLDAIDAYEEKLLGFNMENRLDQLVDGLFASNEEICCELTVYTRKEGCIFRDKDGFLHRSNE